MEKELLVQFLINSGFVSRPTALIIADKFTEKKINKNELLLKEGKICDEYLFLQNGWMRAFAHDTEGNDITTNFYAAGQMVFEVASFFNGTRSGENIQALTDCIAWSISYAQLNQLFHELPEFREFGRHILVKGFSSLKTRMLLMITATAEERYKALLQSTPEIFQQAPLKNIATYLGITDTSLSRIRKEFSKK